MNKKLWTIVVLMLLTVIPLYAQVSVRATDQPISEVIRQIEQSTNYVFVFDEAVRPQLERQVSLQLTDRPIS
jgi:hypothetical protein